jgi:hypothetical protein
MDELQKQRVLVAVVVFNFVTMACQFSFNTGTSFTYPKLLLAVGVGVVAGAIGYVATMLTQK